MIGEATKRTLEMVKYTERILPVYSSVLDACSRYSSNIKRIMRIMASWSVNETATDQGRPETIIPSVAIDSIAMKIMVDLWIPIFVIILGRRERRTKFITAPTI